MSWRLASAEVTSTSISVSPASDKATWWPAVFGVGVVGVDHQRRVVAAHRQHLDRGIGIIRRRNHRHHAHTGRLDGLITMLSGT